MPKIITTSLSQMNKFEADEKYFIVLRPGKIRVSGLRHHPELAPSKELFLWTQNHKNESNWFDTYAEWFKKDMQMRPGLRDAINKLEHDVKNKDILLVCFCADVNRCHRGLIADELIKRGVNVLRN